MYEFIRKLPTPEEIKEQFPVSPELIALKKQRDAEIRDVFTGKSNKFLLIIGPFPFPNDFGLCFIVTYLHEFLKISVKKLKTA